MKGASSKGSVVYMTDGARFNTASVCGLTVLEIMDVESSNVLELGL